MPEPMLPPYSQAQHGQTLASSPRFGVQPTPAKRTVLEPDAMTALNIDWIQFLFHLMIPQCMVLVAAGYTVIREWRPLLLQYTLQSQLFFSFYLLDAVFICSSI